MATVDDVNAEAQGNKLKALQAMAAGQSDPYNAGQQQVRDSQGSALTQLAASAATTGAPVGAMGELAPTVSGPGDAALAAMASGASPLASSLSAVHATPVASGAPSSGLVGTPFPVQRYGPYVRYGGFGSQGELDDAVLGDSRRRAASDSAGYGGAAGAAERALEQAATGQVGQALSGGLGGMGATPPPDTRARPLGLGVSMPQHAPVTTDQPIGMGIYRPSHVQTAAELGAAQHPLTAGLAQGFRGSEQAALNPLELYKYAQESAIAHGAVPAIAEGRYSPEWGSTIALQDLTQPNQLAAADLQNRERASNGGMTFSEQNQIGAAQAAIQARAVQSSPEYLAGQDAITQLAAGVSAGTSKLPSADELRIMLAQSGLPPAVVVQLMKDYGGFAVAGGTAQATDPARFADPYGTTPGNGVGG